MESAPLIPSSRLSPVPQPSILPAPTPAPTPAPPAAKCRSILLVEDNNSIRYAVEELLRSEGYHVLSASNGKEALRSLTSGSSPCLILLDMMMPFMDGWEFLEARQELGRAAGLPVVVISALDAATALSRDHRPVQARGFIRKPIDVDTLLEIVQAHCLRQGERDSDELSEHE